eukprot:382576-Prorocentrum_minimum.AAC.2
MFIVVVSRGWPGAAAPPSWRTSRFIQVYYCRGWPGAAAPPSWRTSRSPATPSGGAGCATAATTSGATPASRDARFAAEFTPVAATST